MDNCEKEMNLYHQEGMNEDQQREEKIAGLEEILNKL